MFVRLRRRQHAFVLVNAAFRVKTRVLLLVLVRTHLGESRCQRVNSSMNQRARFSPEGQPTKPDGHLLQHTHTACDLEISPRLGGPATSA